MAAAVPTDDAPRQMIFGVFGSAAHADEVRTALRAAARRKMIEIIQLAMIKREADGRLEMLEAHAGGKPLEEIRGTLPAMFRLMLGPTEHVSTTTRLHRVAEGLEPDSSAIAALIEHRWIGDLCALMEEAGVDTVTDALRAEVAQALASGNDVVVAAGATEWRGLPFNQEVDQA